MNAPIDDGVIKFDLSGYRVTPPFEAPVFQELELWRKKLFALNLIGEYLPEGIGFGNLSRRLAPGSDSFLISGTQTGKWADLRGEHYVVVDKCHLETGFIEAHGPIAPSSESLTHGAIYQTSPNVNFIFHVHHRGMWDHMIKHGHDSISKGIPYGTMEMAHAARECIGGRAHGIFVMMGHLDGIIAYGVDPANAYQLIDQLHALVSRA